MTRIVVIGDINVDYVLDLEHYPELGGDAIINSFRKQLGGSATSTALYLSQLGRNEYEVYLVSCIGYDEDSEFVLGELGKYNVRLDFIQRLKLPTGKVFVLQVDDERTMFSYRGANKYLLLEDYEIDEIIDESALVHVSGYALLENPQKNSTLKILSEAWKKGVTISLDPGPLIVRENPDVIRGLYSVVKILLINIDEARLLANTNDFLEYFQKLSMDYNNIVVIKMGKEGAVGFHRGFSYWCNTVRIEHPVNIVGAGDAFDAGFLLAYLKGYDISEALIIGCNVAKERIRGKPLEDLSWDSVVKYLRA